MRTTRKWLVVTFSALVALTAACGGGGSGSGAAPGSPVTLTWWHNGTTDPVKSTWQQVADAYHKAHPDVSFQIDPIQNEDFTTKMPLALQSADPPDIFQQWGGGNEASQINSGKVADITDDVSGWIGELGNAAQRWQVNGRQYGVPYDVHVVGFWYRKDLFAQAGITGPPSTMDQFYADVATLRRHGIQPVAIGGKDRWPDGFYWDYFALRECSASTTQQQVQAHNLTDPCWIKAGNDVTTLLAHNPFQTGFLGTPAQQGAGSSAGMVANGKAAMELQGDWEPGTMASLTTDKNLDSEMGWFPFPAVPGGKGQAGAVLGGGDGFSCTTRAAAACAGFLQYIDSTPVQRILATTGAGLPANSAAASAITNPTLRQVLAYSQKAPSVSSYFDIALPTNIGQALDAAQANFFAGQGSAATIVQAVNQAATGGR
jgi:raffinose/stachyose/melibiose transport system substrate-binding protein